MDKPLYNLNLVVLNLLTWVFHIFDNLFPCFLLHFVNVLDLPPKSLPREKSSVPKIQVDVARKVQEDPLIAKGADAYSTKTNIS